MNSLGRFIAHAQCNRFRSYKTSKMAFDMDQIRSSFGAVSETLDRMGLLNNLAYYRKFIEFIKSIPQCEVRQLKDLHWPLDGDHFALALRHDMDMDLFSSVNTSQVLHNAGVRGTFYVQHTAPYYGEFVDRQFTRNTNIIEYLLAIQNSFQCELGLHTDGLWVYQQWGLNGAQAVSSELDWLRSHGIQIFGTSAHNSAPLYGAENFELFEGRAVLNRYILIKNKKRIPLQSLNEDDLALKYEANYADVGKSSHSMDMVKYLNFLPADAIRNEVWMRTYAFDNPYCRWGHDYNLWLIGKDRWLICGHPDRDTVFKWNVTFEDVVNFLKQISTGMHVVCHIHPIYVSRC